MSTYLRRLAEANGPDADITDPAWVKRKLLLLLAEDTLPVVRPDLAVLAKRWWILRHGREGGFSWQPDTLNRREGLIRRAAQGQVSRYSHPLWNRVIDDLAGDWHLYRFINLLKPELVVAELPGLPIPSPDAPPAPPAQP